MVSRQRRPGRAFASIFAKGNTDVALAMPCLVACRAGRIGATPDPGGMCQLPPHHVCCALRSAP